MQTTKKISPGTLPFFNYLFRIAIFALAVALPYASPGGGVVSTPSQSALTSALTGGGTVTFAFNGTITLTSAENISANTVMDGSGYNVIISGGNSSQIFKVGTGVNLTLNNLTIANGFTKTNGGAIYNLGILAATNCSFISNQIVCSNGVSGGSSGQSGSAGASGYGGAIYNDGTTTLEQCQFISNSISGGNGGTGQPGSGGGGGNGGYGGGAYGGAIYSSNVITLFDCALSNNQLIGGAGGAGGAAGNNGSGYYYAAGEGGGGGTSDGVGLFAAGNSTVMRSTFSYDNAHGGASSAPGINGG
ncbi:MAG: hypothetical protein ABSF34_16485, partial [Verrucomicrobiota bacterium]